MRLELTTCIVRQWADGDAESLHRHANNRRVSMHLRDRFPYPYELQHAQTFLSWVRQQPMPTVWAIEVDGEAAGGIGVVQMTDVERVSAEVGYWLGEAFWGRGVMTDALRAITDEAFRQFDLRRIFALPFADNIGSIRVLEKSGYVLEGRMPQSAIKDGVIRDQLMYGTYKRGR